jgi:hypothetical protein
MCVHTAKLLVNSLRSSRIAPTHSGRRALSTPWPLITSRHLVCELVVDERGVLSAWSQPPIRQHPQDGEAGPDPRRDWLSKSQVSDMAKDLDSHFTCRQRVNFRLPLRQPPGQCIGLVDIARCTVLVLRAGRGELETAFSISAVCRSAGFVDNIATTQASQRPDL